MQLFYFYQRILAISPDDCGKSGQKLLERFATLSRLRSIASKHTGAIADIGVTCPKNHSSFKIFTLKIATPMPGIEPALLWQTCQK
jgi:hypothetical protein